jgi:hypothetical protein
VSPVGGRLAGALTGAVCAGMLCTGVLCGCGSSDAPQSHRDAAIRALQRESRPIGHGPRFQSAVTGPVIGPCRREPGRRLEVHVELFAENRVVLVPAGIGVRAPVRHSAGRIVAARCFGRLVTVDPTGVVFVARGATQPPPTLAALFRSWGEPLSTHRLAGFRGPGHGDVRLYVEGRRRFGPPGELALRAHAEIVLEVGPFVEPHHRYTFPPGL